MPKPFFINSVCVRINESIVRWGMQVDISLRIFPSNENHCPATIHLRIILYKREYFTFNVYALYRQQYAHSEAINVKNWYSLIFFKRSNIAIKCYLIFRLILISLKEISLCFETIFPKLEIKLIMYFNRKNILIALHVLPKICEKYRNIVRNN